jgi:selenocysteine lyase/cysteine desulfurase
VAVSTQIEAEVLLGGECASAAAISAREDAYLAIAALLHCEPDEVALTSGATEGLGLILRALRLQPGKATPRGFSLPPPSPLTRTHTRKAMRPYLQLP